MRPEQRKDDKDRGARPGYQNWEYGGTINLLRRGFRRERMGWNWAESLARRERTTNKEGEKGGKAARKEPTARALAKPKICGVGRGLAQISRRCAHEKV